MQICVPKFGSNLLNLCRYRKEADTRSRLCIRHVVKMLTIFVMLYFIHSVQGDALFFSKKHWCGGFVYIEWYWFSELTRTFRHVVGNFWSHWKDFDTWKNGGKIQIFEQKWCFFRFYSRMSLPCKLLWTMLCCLMICIIYIHHLKNIFCNIWWHFFRKFRKKSWNLAFSEVEIWENWILVIFDIFNFGYQK